MSSCTSSPRPSTNPAIDDNEPYDDEPTDSLLPNGTSAANTGSPTPIGLRRQATIPHNTNGNSATTTSGNIPCANVPACVTKPPSPHPDGKPSPDSRSSKTGNTLRWPQQPSADAAPHCYSSRTS